MRCQSKGRINRRAGEEGEGRECLLSSPTIVKPFAASMWAKIGRENAANPGASPPLLLSYFQWKRLA